MNFNEEIDKELKSEGIYGSKVVNIPKKDKATSEDYAKFEAKLALKTSQNEIMLKESAENAKKSILG